MSPDDLIPCAFLYDDTINAQSSVELLKQIEQQHPRANRIHIISNNARYYRKRATKLSMINFPHEASLVFLTEMRNGVAN